MANGGCNVNSRNRLDPRLRLIAILCYRLAGATRLGSDLLWSGSRLNYAVVNHGCLIYLNKLQTTSRIASHIRQWLICSHCKSCSWFLSHRSISLSQMSSIFVCGHVISLLLNIFWLAVCALVWPCITMSAPKNTPDSMASSQ